MRPAICPRRIPVAIRVVPGVDVQRSAFVALTLSAAPSSLYRSLVPAGGHMSRMPSAARVLGNRRAAPHVGCAGACRSAAHLPPVRHRHGDSRCPSAHAERLERLAGDAAVLRPLEAGRRHAGVARRRQTPVIVRMETLRRASAYSVDDKALATRLLQRARGANDEDAADAGRRPGHRSTTATWWRPTASLASAACGQGDDRRRRRLRDREDGAWRRCPMTRACSSRRR